MENSKEKQIEEMADEIKIAHDEQKYLTSDKSIKAIAKHLYNEGYRKTAVLAEEIFAEIEAIIRKHDERPKYQLMLDLAELKKKYTEEEK